MIAIGRIFNPLFTLDLENCEEIPETVINIEPMGRAKQHPELILTADDYRYMFDFIREKRLQGYDAVVDYRETEKLLGWKAKHTAADFYDEIYKFGSLKYEIETFSENGKCQIKYYR